MTPKRRAIYKRIRKRRDAMGPLSFSIVDALREMRANG
jgi:hypothetical protein